MTYFSNSMLRGLFFLFLTLATGNLCAALQPQPTLKRSKNFNIKHSDDELTDLIEAARLEKNDAILGCSLYEYGCDSEFVKNLSMTMALNNVPPQNVFAIMQAYIKCIDDDDNLSLIILSSFVDHVLQQSVIGGNLNYVTYFLNIPECENLIFSESIIKALKNLKSCNDIHVHKTIELLLHNYLKQHLKVVLNFCLFLMPAQEQ